MVSTPSPSGRPGGATVDSGRELIASFTNYRDAQHLVDRMSDGGFPVEAVQIVGDGVRTVEHVTGRMTTGKASLAGAGSGAWFGLLIGLLLAIFTIGLGPLWLWVLLTATAIGAFWGAVFGFVAHRSTRGQRDFSSVLALVAQRYDVYVAAPHAGEAAPFVFAARDLGPGTGDSTPAP